MQILTCLQSEQARVAETSPATIGGLIKYWAGLIDQGKNEFTSKIKPKLTRLIIDHYQKTKQIGISDDYIFA